MTQRSLEWRTALLAGVLVATIAGCGGGSDDDKRSPPPAEQQAPASASASIDGFIAYLKLLVGSNADALEPVDVGSVTPPVDETSEPQKVD